MRRSSLKLYEREKESERPKGMSKIFHVGPERKVGDFSFGMPINDAVDCLQNNKSSLGTFQIKYDAQHPTKNDLLIFVPDVGLLLRFDPLTQRLHKIIVYDPDRCSLKFPKVCCWFDFNNPFTYFFFIC